MGAGQMRRAFVRIVVTTLLLPSPSLLQENMMHYTRSGEMGLRAQHSPEREDSRTAPRHPYTSPPPSNTVVEIYPSTEDLQRSRSSFSRQ